MELGKLTREERNILVGENIEVVSNFKPYLAHNGFRRPYNSALSVNGATLPFLVSRDLRRSPRANHIFENMRNALRGHLKMRRKVN